MGILVRALGFRGCRVLEGLLYELTVAPKRALGFRGSGFRV